MSVKFSSLGMICVAGAFVACTPEPARRSAVDASQLCNSDPSKPVFAGTCLSTQSTRNEGDGSTQGDSDLKPSPSPSPSPSPEPEIERPLPSPSPSPSPSSGPGPGAGPGAVLPEIGKILEPILNRPTAPKPGGGGGDTAGKTYLVTFTKDSFVGIADDVVVKNCLYRTGSVIEVKSSPQLIDNFSSYGVKQYVGIETVSVTLPDGSADKCGLVGKDFVYLGAHAQISEKP